MKTQVILDVDTGSDDAVALMLAELHKDIDLVAVCTVAGNLSIAHTTDNTLRVLQALHAHTPVYRGCSAPLVKHLCNNNVPVPPYNPTDEDGNPLVLHQETLDLPCATRTAQTTPAPVFYLEYLKQATEPVTIIAVGPLTNLAAACIIDADVFKHNVAQIIVMGGGYHVTNVTSSAEFNAWADPEAMQIVASCGAKVVFVPLDATHKACVTKDDCERLRTINTIASNFAATLCEERIAVHNVQEPLHIPDSAAVHDALAVAYAIDPDVLQDVQPVHLCVGLGDFAQGQTILDMRYHTEEKNCFFAFDANRERFVDLLCDTFES